MREGKKEPLEPPSLLSSAPGLAFGVLGPQHHARDDSSTGAAVILAAVRGTVQTQPRTPAPGSCFRPKMSIRSVLRCMACWADLKQILCM